jgi:hypothetical protein
MGRLLGGRSRGRAGNSAASAARHEHGQRAGCGEDRLQNPEPRIVVGRCRPFTPHSDPLARSGYGSVTVDDVEGRGRRNVCGTGSRHDPES